MQNLPNTAATLERNDVRIAQRRADETSMVTCDATFCNADVNTTSDKRCRDVCTEGLARVIGQGQGQASRLSTSN